MRTCISKDGIVFRFMNSPKDGYVADIMRRTRALYHYTIRKLKNNAELLRK